MAFWGDFLFHRHEPQLVLLAAVICLLSSYACISLVRHARKSAGRLRRAWIAVAALAVGIGVWSTHFIAMLGFQIGLAVQYDVGVTVLSLALAVVISGCGILIAVDDGRPLNTALGGAVVGLGISAMHFTGMSAVELGGSVVWDFQRVAASIIAGAGLGGLAFFVGCGGHWKRLAAGALLLTLAVCIMHFTAMAAANFANCFAITPAFSAFSPELLSIAIGLASALILLVVLGSVVLDNLDRRRTQRELERRLADRERIDEIGHRLQLALTHMGQALCLYDRNGRVVVHNARMPELVGLPPTMDLTGMTTLEVNRAIGTAAHFGDVEEIEQRAVGLYNTHMALIRAGKAGEILHQSLTGRSLRVAYHPFADGSWLTTIDDVTDRQQSLAKIAHMARHDELTGLPNRKRFIDVLEVALSQADKSQASVAVVEINLNDFNSVNDRHGYAIGDQALKAIAEGMEAECRSGEMVARLGGDRFAAHKTLASKEDARDFTERLQRSLFRTLEIDGVVIDITASLGVAIYPGDAADCDKLLANADLALTRASAHPDQRLCYYDPSRDERARHRREIASALSSAIANDEFFLVFQEQQTIKSRETTGYEVLLRWRHPTRGMIPPGEFIPVAEESGAIAAIGLWVLETACALAVRHGLGKRIAVNLSPLQLSQPDLAQTIADILQQTGMAADRLELEVTESAIIADKPHALANLRRLKDMDVAISLDDFGAGYSSLETLRSFPFDKIKLDRSLVTELETNSTARAMMRAVIALGKSLGVHVLAEGVETAEQLAILRAKGCDEIQGYLLGRPVPIDELLKLARMALAS